MNINKITYISDNYEFLNENEELLQIHQNLNKNTIIIYSYSNGHWPETKKELNNFNIKYNEYDDEFGESYILINPATNKINNY